MYCIYQISESALKGDAPSHVKAIAEMFLKVKEFDIENAKVSLHSLFHPN
jgi:hypothetical protein